MNQIAIIYEKDTKALIAYMEFNDIITDCNMLKIPSVEIVITKKVPGLFYISNNKYYVNTDLIYRKDS